VSWPLLAHAERRAAAIVPLTTDRRIFLAGDQPWRWKGVSAFPLCDRFARGDSIDPFLHAFAGFNLLRVWDYVMWPDTGWPSQPASAWKDFIAYVTARGFYVELTALTDDDPARIEPAKRLIRELAGTPGLLIEAGNEPTTHKHIDTAALRSTLEAAGLPHASGDGDARFYGTYGTAHTPRDHEWQRKAHDLFEYYNGGGPGAPTDLAYPVPWIADEPTRPDEDGYHAENYRGYFGACALLGGGGTFHYDGGKYAHLPTPDEARCAAAALEGLNAFPEGEPNSGYRRIDEQGRSLRTYAVGNGMVRIPPLTTKDAPEPGWTPIDHDGILWRRE
jgi:hypothetical protein